MEEQLNPPPPPPKPDRSLLYIGIGLSVVILIMGYLAFFVNDPSTIFAKKEAPRPAPIIVKEVDLLKKSADMSDEAIKASLIKFIEAFYEDQNNGYFDPPSYFSDITQTYYHYHNLTFGRLLDVYNKRLTDMHQLQQTWIVSSLKYKHEATLLSATFNVKTNYFKPSTSKQESAFIKMKIIIDKEGKICSLQELEKRITSSVHATDPAIIAALSNSLSNPMSSSLSIPISIAPISTSAGTSTLIADLLYDVHTVDVIPEFKGGQKALMAYLKANLKYPDQAKMNKLQGNVFVQFIVEKDGKLTNFEVINGIGSGCNEEAIRVLQNSPSWEPGRFQGKFVRTRYSLAIPFQLENLSK